jgi:hypothetical protein
VGAAPGVWAGAVNSTEKVAKINVWIARMIIRIST